MEELKEETKKRNYSKQGKLNRAAGQRFEAKVREDLEKMGWVVGKWMNTLDYNRNENTGKIVPAKRKYNPFKKVMVLGTGFPDFIAFKNNINNSSETQLMSGFCEICKKESFGYNTVKGFVTCNSCGKYIPSLAISQAEIIGVEVKANGYLDQAEKGMCYWLIQNKIFSKMLIAKKGEKRGNIEYINFLEKYKKDFPAQ